MADLCDVTWALLIGQVDALALAMLTAGGDPAEAEPGVIRARLSEWMESPLRAADAADPEEYELKQALGLVV